ncbi:MAG: hypothetical protein M3Z26_18270, partial [Bacteroidota bacterium]|nr:hypothetical protein [Bacteroidota bacterium]
GNEGMGIPRYILINKKGKIIIDDAIPPRNTEQLMNQISKALKGKITKIEVKQLLTWDLLLCWLTYKSSSVR